MSILARFTGAPSLTKQMYDTTIRHLEAEGLLPPDGLEYHVAFGSDGNFRVSEIWDSRAKFDAFGQRLMPILAAGESSLRARRRSSRSTTSSSVSVL